MKIRSDYVSNSSSSSFIIDFKDDKGACVDEGFMRMLKHLNGIRLRGTCESLEQLKEFREKASKVFGSDIDDWSDEVELDFSVSISDESIMVEDGYGQMNFIKDVLQLKDGQLYVDAGDDWGDELVKAVKVAVLLECRYPQIEIVGDDHFDYSTIRGTDLDI